MQKITPFLWFDNNAEEAMTFYTSIFKDSSIENVARYTKDSPGLEGSVMTAAFTLNGQPFIALNGGPVYKFSPAISFVIDCETQDEVDHYWERLSTGGEKNQCGWLTDKFGVTWQVVPTILGKLLSDSDSEKVYRATQAMLKMTRLNIAELVDAFENKQG
jgi:predicted 3-demethylubiquinone-9 3-methyltransferase (glyoxalase superfamily)